MWALALVSNVMDAFLEMFIELDLLQHSELCSYYWYCDYITSTRGFALKSLRELRNDLDKQLYEIDMKSAKDAVTRARAAVKKKKNKKDKEVLNTAKTQYENMMAKPPPTPIPFSSEEIYLVMKGQMHKAMFRVYMAFNEGGVIKQSSSPCSSPELMFATRYRSFLSISNPTPIGYADFVSTKTSSPPETLVPASLFESAGNILKTIKSLTTRAVVAVPPEYQSNALNEGRHRLPRCVCKSGLPATASLAFSERYPHDTLEDEPETPLHSKSLFLQDIIAINEGQAKVSQRH